MTGGKEDTGKEGGREMKGAHKKMIESKKEKETDTCKKKKKKRKRRSK